MNQWAAGRTAYYDEKIKLKTPHCLPACLPEADWLWRASLFYIQYISTVLTRVPPFCRAVFP
jgi:hypothetical protein